MTVVFEPQRRHVCRPGVTERRIDRSAPYAPAFDIALVRPTPWDYPRGTVIRCECGKTWVSEGSPAAHMPGVCTFRREGRLARWWRERSR